MGTSANVIPTPPTTMATPLLKTPREVISYDEDTLTRPVLSDDPRLLRRSPKLAVIEPVRIYREGKIFWEHRIGALEFIARRETDELAPQLALATPYVIRRQRTTGSGLQTWDTTYHKREVFECLYYGTLGI